MKVLLKPISEQSTDIRRPRVSLGAAQLEQSPPIVSQHDLDAHKWRSLNQGVAVTLYVDEHLESLRRSRLELIRRRRQVRSNLWYLFSTTLQREVAELEANIRSLGEQIFAKTRTTANFDELFAELKQGHEKLASCLQRLENQHGQEGSH